MRATKVAGVRQEEYELMRVRQISMRTQQWCRELRSEEYELMASSSDFDAGD